MVTVVARAWVASAVVAASLVTSPATAEQGAVWTLTYPSPTVAMTSRGMYGFRDGAFVALHWSSSEGDMLLRSADFGTTWTTVPPSPSARGFGLTYLAMSTPRAGYASAHPRDERASAYDGGVLLTNDGGRSWHRFLRLPRRPGSVAMHGTSLRSSPGGRSAIFTGWTRDAKRLMPGTEVVWIADSGRGVRRSALGTTYWGWSTSSLLDDRTAAVAAAEYHPGAPWTPGTPCCASYKTGLWVTRDAGRTWRKMATLDDEITSLDWVTPDRLIMASGRHGTIYVSTDGGRRIAPVGAVRLFPPGSGDDGTHPPAVQIDFVTPRVGYANACQSGMWRTDSGGESWELEASANHGDIFTQPFCSNDGIAAADEQHAVTHHASGILTRQPSA